jgi:hypothetical protein
MSDPQMLFLVHREIVRNLEEERERRALRACRTGTAARRTSGTAWSSVVGRLTGRHDEHLAVCCCPA